MPLQGPFTLRPLPRPPKTSWRVPGSKSITNRALVLAALAEGESVLEGVLDSDDTRHMRAALEGLGIEITVLDATTLRVRGGRSRLRRPRNPVFVGNSGTTVRFLAPLACLVEGPVTLIGDEHMARRPIADLVEGLEQLGVSIECNTGCPPITIRGTGNLRGGTVTMRGDRSSQYFSALLLAGAAGDATIDLVVRGELVSRPFVEITRRMVADFGGRIEASREGFTIRPSSYRARRYPIEPDATSASYPFSLAAGSAGEIRVPGLGEGSIQGDYRFVDLLEQSGAHVIREQDATVVRGAGELSALDVDMRDISDTVMTLAALAVTLRGPTRISNVANIRIKETDRLTALATELDRLGQRVSAGPDWIRIDPRPIVPATIHCYADHRIAMSFGVLGALRAGISIEDPACVAKTYPTFWDDLEECYRSTSAGFP
jgi:3-phosphoshikimate 1-carboxyvinyltransferase